MKQRCVRAGSTPAVLAVALVFLMSAAGGAQADADKALEKKVSAVVSRMTMSEKIAMLGGDRGFYLRGCPRLGIPAVKMADGPMGVGNSGKATAFPASLCMAATFNPALIQRVGGAIGRECRAKGVGILLAPGVNIYRIPQNGRNFEYYGEDPYLASRMAVAFVQGVQSQRVIATVKHFAANNLEYDRHRTSSDIDESTLQEIYLPAFRAAVQEGRCGAVMTAYNLLNGVHCSENAHLIKDILKGDWGFKGFVMSDWISVYSTKAATAGLDLEMPKAQFMTVENILVALKNNMLSAAEIDDKVRRIVRTCLAVDVYQAATPSLSEGDWQTHQQVALQVAEEGIVLLKNENGLLPIAASQIARLAILGPNAQATPTSGGGAAYVELDRQDSIVDGIKHQLGSAGRVEYIPYSTQTALDATTAAKIKACDAAIVCIGFNDAIEGEGHDHPFDLPDEQVNLVRAVQAENPRTIVLMNSGGAVGMKSWLSCVPAVMHISYLGQVSGTAVAALLFGAVNPSGKLPFSIERSWPDAAAYGAYDVAKSEAGLPPLFTLHGQAHEIIPVPYREGLFVGYRHFDHSGIAPLFPFGFGLSYTTFRITAMAVKRRSAGEYRVDVTVANSGACPGQEVVQLYVSAAASKIPRPLKELKGFAKVLLQPGESKTVTISLARDVFAYYSIQDHCWRVDPGEYHILAGDSSSHLPLRQTITIDSAITFK